MRIILTVMKQDNTTITVVTKEGESIEECLNRRCPNWKAYKEV